MLEDFGVDASVVTVRNRVGTRLPYSSILPATVARS